MRTKHFSNEDWADFARQKLPADRGNAMEAHLEEGCHKCKRTLQFWSSVFDLADAELFCSPPNSTIRSVRGFFGLHKPPKLLPRALEVARLVFDSFRQPLPAGVRAGFRPPRQVLFKSGRFWVDLRLEKKLTSDRVTLVGQVLDASSPDKGVKDVPVFLLSGPRTLAHTETNRIGEFHLDVSAVRRPRVCVGVSKDKAVVVPLPVLGRPQRGTRRARQGD